MKDGHYELVFSADGYSGRGHLVVDGTKAIGGDGQYHVEGSVQDSRQHLTASFNVSIEPDVVANARVPHHFTLQMTGMSNDRDFSLIGIGPLGLIVEFSCSYRGSAA